MLDLLGSDLLRVDVTGVWRVWRFGIVWEFGERRVYRDGGVVSVSIRARRAGPNWVAAIFEVLFGLVVNIFRCDYINCHKNMSKKKACKLSFSILFIMTQKNVIII